jgi:RNA recognition motif-containing protein
VFRQFGPIYEEETFVKNRNYGFVRFRHRKHAEMAKREMNNKVLGARAIRIGWGDANYQRHCVHIQFEPAESEALTESEVIAKFEEFGTVMSVNLPRNQGQLRGFGFIYYDDTDAGENSAARAITTLNSSPICGVRIQCNYGKKPSNKKKKQQQQQKVPGRPRTSLLPPCVVVIACERVYADGWALIGWQVVACKAWASAAAAGEVGSRPSSPCR